jgi:hypothetical protein
VFSPEHLVDCQHVVILEVCPCSMKNSMGIDPLLPHVNDGVAVVADAGEEA